jgi:hypothetical protein
MSAAQSAWKRGLVYTAERHQQNLDGALAIIVLRAGRRMFVLNVT